MVGLGVVVVVEVVAAVQPPFPHIHVIEESNLPLLVGDDGEVQSVAADLLYIGSPALVAVDGVGREADQLDAALGELGLETGELAQLGGANGSVVLGVGEEDGPLVADELVEVDLAICRLCVKVGSGAAQAEGCYAFAHGGI